MTKTIFQNWKVIAGISVATVLLGGAFSFDLFIPKAEAGFEPICEVQHWDKIIFKSKKDILDADGVVILDKKAIMDIKVLDDPAKIEFPMQKAADRLNLPGWTTDKGVPFTPDDLKLVDIEYAIVCLPF